MNGRKPKPLHSFTMGADPESEKWDNRKNAPWRVKDAERQSAFLAEHQEILQYLRGVLLMEILVMKILSRALYFGGLASVASSCWLVSTVAPWPITAVICFIAAIVWGFVTWGVLQPEFEARK